MPDETGKKIGVTERRNGLVRGPGGLAILPGILRLGTQNWPGQPFDRSLRIIAIKQNLPHSVEVPRVGAAGEEGDEYTDKALVPNGSQDGSVLMLHV